MGTVVFCLDIVITLAGRTCEPIKIPICQKHLPYNMTMFPNALEHLTQQYSRQRIELYSDIVAINCSADAGFFLCAYHLPICAPEFKSRPIRPCRSVCKKVMRECMPTIRKYNREWPPDVVCKDLPSYESDVCIKPESFVKSVSSCRCIKPRVNYQRYKRNSYHFILKVFITSTTEKDNGGVIEGKIERILQKSSIHLRKGDSIYLHRNTSCNCPQVPKVDASFLVAGHVVAEQHKLYLFRDTGLIVPWERAWVEKFRKWERRLAVKSSGRKKNRRNKKLKRKAFSSPNQGH